MATKDPNYWKNYGGDNNLDIGGFNQQSYNIVGSSFDISKFTPSGKSSSVADLAATRQLAIDFMNKGGLGTLGPTDIFKGVSAGSFYKTNPQYVLKQFVGADGLRDGMTVFGFDIEALGSFGPEAKSGFYAPTELAMRAYKFNGTNPKEYQAWQKKTKGSMKLKSYFDLLDGGEMSLARRLDDSEVTYVEGLLKQLERRNSLHQATDISQDDLRSLRDLMKYANGAEFRNGGVYAHNTNLPAESLLTSSHIGKIKEGMRNLQAHGLQTDEFLRRTNEFVERHTKNSMDKAFKVMAYNGTQYDVPGLEHKFGDRLDLIHGNKHARYTGNIDWYATANALYSDPVKRIYKDAYGAQQVNLTQGAIANYLFGYDTTGAHVGSYDIRMQEDIANFFMNDVKKVYMSGNRGALNVNGMTPLHMRPTPGGIAMSTYNPGYIDVGDKLYAHSGAGRSGDTVFDMVFKFNQGKYDYLDYYNNPISTSKTYVMNGMFNMKGPGNKSLYGMVLYNEDDDLHHMILRDDPRKLQNLVHEKFSYLGGRSDPARQTQGLVRTYTDSARREYLKMFTPSMDQNPGQSFELLKTYLDANDKVQAALADGSLKPHEIAQHGYGKISGANISKIEQVTGLSNAKARNYAYMRGRFQSEAPLLRAFATELGNQKITGSTADLALYNFKLEMDSRAGEYLDSIAPKHGSEQMFIFDPVRHEYKLADTADVSRLTSTINTIVTQGKDPAQYKVNAHQIVNDLHDRGYLNGDQMERLHKLVSKMDATEVDPARSTQFMRSISSEIMQGKWSGKDSVDEFVRKTTKEFYIANTMAKSGDVAAGVSPTDYFATKVKGGVRANYLQESMKARKAGSLSSIDGGVMSSAIEKASRITGSAGNGALQWDQEARNFFNAYDQAMVGRLRSLSNPSHGIDFARGYRGLGSALNDLAAAYINADPDHATAVTAALSENKQSLLMVVYNKKDTAEIMRKGSIKGGLSASDKSLRMLEIPIANMANNTIQLDRQDIMNPVFLNVKYKAQATWHNVEGTGLTEEIIKQYRMGARNIMRPYLRGGSGSIEDFNRSARMHMHRATQRASGSGRLIGTVEPEAMDASNQAVMWQRGAYVNVSGLTGLVGIDKNFDDLFEDSFQNFMRKLSDSATEHGLPLTFAGVKDSAALHGLMSSRSSREMVPFGAYGANTRFNYQQYNSYYNLGKYDIYNPDEKWRFQAGVTTQTSFDVINKDLPEIMTKVAWMNDDRIMAGARAAGMAADGGLLSTAEGMVIVSEDLKRYLSVSETKRIEVPHGMKLSPEMLELLQRAKGGENVYIPDYGPGNKFTVATAEKESVRRGQSEADIFYNNKFKSRVIGQTEYKNKLVIELEQYLDPEDSMKAFFGTDKGTLRFAPQAVIDAITGQKGIDAILGSEMSKRRDYNNVISGVVNQAMIEAQAGNIGNDRIASAFNDVFGIDLKFEPQKITIGSTVVDRMVPVMPNMINSLGNAKRIDPRALMGFREALGLSSQPAGDILTGMQGMRLSMVSRYPIPFGGKTGLDEGVRYGLRELEVIRNKRIVIGGKSYGTAESTYNWFNDTIGGRASRKFKGRFDKFLGGIDTTLRSFNDESVTGASPIYMSRETSAGALRFQSMKEIVGTEGLSRADLKGTILNPDIGKANGFWLETPFDWTLDGQSMPRNKVFMMKDDVSGVDGNLRLTEIQNRQLAIERHAREWLDIQEGRILPVGDETKQGLLDATARRGNAAVNEYIKQVGKDAMGSHGRVAYDMMSAKLGNSGHFTIAGMNVYGNGSEWDNLGKAVSSNTGFISEDYARGMLKDSGLSKVQIDDIIDVMSNGEGAFSVSNRYPTFDQGALVFGRTKISRRLTGDQAVISVGDAAMMKADYDGDHLSKVLAFSNYVKDSGMKYSDMLAASDENYQKIMAGNLSLKDIKDEGIRAFTEFRMLSESDNQRSVTLGNYIKASYTNDVKFDKMRMGNLDYLQELTGKGGAYEDFGKLLPGAGSFTSDEFLTREARIMKAVGSASNLNARMRRMAETLTKTPEFTYTIGKEMTNVTTGSMLFNSLLPQDVWDEISTIGSINEQGGIGSKHILPLMEKMGINPNSMTANQQQAVFDNLKMFKYGLEHFDAGALRTAQSNFKMLGVKDILRLGAGEISSASIEEAFVNGLEGAQSADEIDAFMKSFRFLGKDKDTAINSLIGSVEKLGQFTDAYNFSSNPFLKYSLSSPGSSMKAIEGWEELTNPYSDQFIPTDEVKRLYQARNKLDDFQIGAQRYAERMSQASRDVRSKFVGWQGDNFAKLTDELRPMKTIGDDALERATSKIVGGVGGRGMANGIIGGAIGAGAVWAASAVFRQGPEEDSVEMPQANQAPSSDGKYVDPAIFGPAPVGAAPSPPTGRIAMRGGGYENIGIVINAQGGNMSEGQIRDIVQQQLREQMPVDVNMNLNSRDNTQQIDRQWVNETVTKAIRFGYAY